MSNTTFEGQNPLYRMPATESRYNSQKSRQVAQMGRKRPKSGSYLGGCCPSVPENIGIIFRLAAREWQALKSRVKYFFRRTTNVFSATANTARKMDDFRDAFGDLRLHSPKAHP